ncbi:cation/calcium exchanger 1 [Lactuca sativa]|uniref:cation/calcium exchanger 1 n=1 Tax=Lactuca sativa TaxID=4236 RepID=UPI000CACB3EA|nr:cation/calcium exchanger 1 [Lactuca sativa]
MAMSPSKLNTAIVLFITISFHLTSSAYPLSNTITTTCTNVHHHNSSLSKCMYVQTHADCHPKGYINYLKFFYCTLSRFPQLGFLLLLLWLLILFYVLSNTASDYFCPAVENLSEFLNLSPAIAGTTLLPLGNGSPDVFASIISFTASGDGGDIGLNSILGGAIFVSTVVVGILSLLISYRRKVVIVDKPNFIRDVVFLLFSLSNLLVIILIGKISFWASILFASTYIIYISLVSYMHFISKKKQKIPNDHHHHQGPGLPLLASVNAQEKRKPSADKVVPHRKGVIILLLYVAALPLYLPRKLTIPLITQDKWSKPYAVISVALAPVTLALILSTQQGLIVTKANMVTWSIALAIGLALGTCTFALTSSAMAPQKCLFIWHASGFLMSVIWTYITAEELVSLLESLGTIIGMNPSVLGLTILAWGNSLGDLTSNVAMTMHDGPDGAQIAIAGCYAGPVFNIFVGLGFSFVIACWSDYPVPYMVPVNPHLCETVGFMICGLLWALVVLTKREMRLDRTLAVGLLAIYFCFLFVKVARVVGLIDVSVSNPLKTL